MVMVTATAMEATMIMQCLPKKMTDNDYVIITFLIMILVSLIIITDYNSWS